jgi:metal-sulfur cluster biosynthetic enzyme
MADQMAVLEAMHDVIDPELGLDVVELGMVGAIEITDRDVLINMRLTSMSCPFWDLFVEQVNLAVEAVDGVDRVVVQFDRTEPWTPQRMSEPARRQLEAVGLMPPSFRHQACPKPEREELLQIAVGVLGSPRRRGGASTPRPNRS